MNDKLKIVFKNEKSQNENKKLDDISKKVQKIEKLTIDFALLKSKIKDLKLQVDVQSAQEKHNFCKAKQQYIMLLIGKHDLKGLTLWQKEILEGLISEEYKILVDFNYESAELHKIYSNFVQKLNNEMTLADKESAKSIFEKMMSDYGLEDDDEFDFSKLNDPIYQKEFEEKIHQQQDKKRQEQIQLDKEKQVAATNIDFQKVYKKLAKLTHPDLYKTESEKAIKEEQMQRLTKIWEERNYYELLMIWLEVDPDNTINLEITETNQKSIIKQLNEKITGIESEMYRIKFFYPETSFYYQNFKAASQTGVSKKIDKYISVLNDNIKNTSKNTVLFAKTTNLKKHLAKIYDERQEDNFGDFLRNFGHDFD